MKIFKKIKLANDVTGFLTDREGQLLYSLAYACQGKGAVVEIGSWKGKSTVWLANGIKDKNLPTKIFAIDPHAGYLGAQVKNAVSGTFDEFQQNIRQANVEPWIVPIVKTSKEAVVDFIQPVELLFIDGVHEFEFVNEDYHLWAPRVLNGGRIAFHDTPMPGVARVIETIFKNDLLKNVYFTDTLLVAQKATSLSGFDKIKNKLMLSLNRQFHAACQSTLPKPIRSRWKDMIKLSRWVIAHL